MGKRIVFAVMVAGLLPAATHAQNDDLVGCYDVTIGEWSPALPSGGGSGYFAPPPRIELADTPALRLGRSIADRRAVTPAPGVMPSLHRMAFWWTVAPDSVAIVWSTGFTGVRLHLRPDESGLEGSARSFTDVGGAPVHDAPAVARRIACDAPVPEAWRDRYAYGRGFLLPTGDSLLLGAPLPSGVTGDSVGSATLLLDIHPRVLAGATSIGVRLDRDGNVRSIRAEFPSDTRLDDLVRRMEAVWGPASSVWSDTSVTGKLRSGASWNDPLINKMLGRNTMLGGEIDVIVYMASRSVIRGRRRERH